MPLIDLRKQQIHSTVTKHADALAHRLKSAFLCLHFDESIIPRRRALSSCISPVPRSYNAHPLSHHDFRCRNLPFSFSTRLSSRSAYAIQSSQSTRQNASTSLECPNNTGLLWSQMWTYCIATAANTKKFKLIFKMLEGSLLRKPSRLVCAQCRQSTAAD